MKDEICGKIEQEKIIVIVRGVESEKLIPLDEVRQKTDKRSGGLAYKSKLG